MDGQVDNSARGTLVREGDRSNPAPLKKNFPRS